jgi:3-hydroxyacyl-[acyl-carrier-protein] dehydratase
MSLSFPIPMPMYTEAIRELLPQRYPFLMVDRVLSVEPGKSIVAIKNVTVNEEYFQGHFPELPVMPGVLMLEAMAQVSGILGFITEEKLPADGYIYLFAGVDKLRFKRRVIPGDTLTITASIITSKQKIYKFACQIHVGAELAASGEIMVIEQNNGLEK